MLFDVYNVNSNVNSEECIFVPCKQKIIRPNEIICQDGLGCFLLLLLLTEQSPPEKKKRIFFKKNASIQQR